MLHTVTCKIGKICHDMTSHILHFASYCCIFSSILCLFSKYGEICPFVYCTTSMSSQNILWSFPEPGGVADAVISMFSSSSLHLAGVGDLFKFMNYIKIQNMKNIQNMRNIQKNMRNIRKLRIALAHCLAMPEG